MRLQPTHDNCVVLIRPRLHDTYKEDWDVSYFSIDFISNKMFKRGPGPHSESIGVHEFQKMWPFREACDDVLFEDHGKHYRRFVCDLKGEQIHKIRCDNNFIKMYERVIEFECHQFLFSLKYFVRGNENIAPMLHCKMLSVDQNKKIPWLNNMKEQVFTVWSDSTDIENLYMRFKQRLDGPDHDNDLM